MAAAHVTGAGLLRASRDQAAPLPQAARGLRACCCSGGGVGGADVWADVRGAPGPGAGERGCGEQAAADSTGLHERQTPGQNPAPGTRPPEQPAREVPRGGAGRSPADRFWGAGEGRGPGRGGPCPAALRRGREGRVTWMSAASFTAACDLLWEGKPALHHL